MKKYLSLLAAIAAPYVGNSAIVISADAFNLPKSEPVIRQYVNGEQFQQAFTQFQEVPDFRVQTYSTNVGRLTPLAPRAPRSELIDVQPVEAPDQNNVYISSKKSKVDEFFEELLDEQGSQRTTRLRPIHIPEYLRTGQVNGIQPQVSNNSPRIASQWKAEPVEWSFMRPRRVSMPRMASLETAVQDPIPQMAYAEPAIYMAPMSGASSLPTYTLNLSSNPFNGGINYDLTISSDNGDNSTFDINTIDSLALWGVLNSGTVSNFDTNAFTSYSQNLTSFELVDNGINPDGFDYTLTSGGTGASSITLSWTINNPDAWKYGDADITFTNIGGDQLTYNFGNVPIGAIPEPSTFALMAGGLAALAAAMRRKRLNKK